MVGKRLAGFTIVEITLFLGISGLLFLIALAGTSNTIRTFRFNDTGRSLETFVQKQYDDIVNGLNSRPNSISCTGGVINTLTGQEVGSSNCLLMGRLLVFRAGNSTVDIYNVIGTEPSNANYSLSDSQLISAFQPVAVTTAATSTYTLPWGAQMSGFERADDNVGTNGLLLVRSPKSSRIVSYTFVVPATVPTSLTSLVNDGANLLKQTNFCFRNADGLGAPAKLRISGGATQEAAKVTMNATTTECDGA